MIYFYNLWLLQAFYMSTPALGLPSFRFFIGVMSYLANINRFAGLRVQLNQSAFSFFCSSDLPCSVHLIHLHILLLGASGQVVGGKDLFPLQSYCGQALIHLLVFLAVSSCKAFCSLYL